MRSDANPGMNRWAFLARLLGTVAAAALVRPALEELAPAPAPGIAVRFIRDYEIVAAQTPVRLDVLYGVATVRPALACRVLG